MKSMTKPTDDDSIADAIRAKLEERGEGNSPLIRLVTAAESDLNAAEAAIAQWGILVSGDRESAGPKANPAVRVKQQAMNILLRIAVEVGLTPKASRNVGAPEIHEEDPLDEYIGR